MIRSFGVAVLSLALVAAAEPAPEPVPADDAVLTTKWSLKKEPVGKPVAGQRRVAGTGSAKATNVNTKKPRVFGGATVNNRGNRKAHGQVGLKLPF